MIDDSPFDSFWMAGFECADHLNRDGERIDMHRATAHPELVGEDYANLSVLGIRTVREGILWSQVEKTPYCYSWDQVGKLIEAGKQHGIQQVWDLCHFGFPDDLTPLHPKFASRFESLCLAFLQYYRLLRPTGILIVTPINEVGFISWLGGEVGQTQPYCTQYGWSVKYALMKAYIRGVAIMKSYDPHVLILTTEPLVNIVPEKISNGDEFLAASRENEEQFQVLNMLTGKICPELGGKPSYVDVIGYNYYHNNQWLVGLKSFLPWFNEPFDSRWLPLRSMLTRAYQRFPYPFVLSETSHPGIDRPNWIRYIAGECAALLTSELPFMGICLYPILDNPDWNDADHWHHAGLWDRTSTEKRVLYQPYYEAFLEVQATISGLMKKPKQVSVVE